VSAVGTSPAKGIPGMATKLIPFAHGLPFALISLLLASCTQSVASRQDVTSAFIARGFLAQEPCGPPCFLGMEPGISTESEVRGILEELGLYQHCEGYDTEEEGGSRGLVCGGFLVGYRPASDIVEVIGFSLPSEATVDDVIAVYGAPQSALAGREGIPEFPKTGMSLFYPHIRVTLGLPPQEGTVYKVVPSTLVSGVTYHDPESYARVWGPELPRWEGYGEYPQTDFFHSAD